MNVPAFLRFGLRHISFVLMAAFVWAYARCNPADAWVIAALPTSLAIYISIRGCKDPGGRFGLAAKSVIGGVLYVEFTFWLVYWSYHFRLSDFTLWLAKWFPWL